MRRIEELLTYLHYHRLVLDRKKHFPQTCWMDVRLDSLESKITQVLALCRRLGEETRQLRAQVAELEAQRRTLTDKIDTARDRLESLKAKLPRE